MRSGIVTLAILLASISECRAQNCVISGGTNYGSIIQNCNFTPPPLSIVSSAFENIRMPDGTFRHRIFVQVGQPITLLLVACGDGILDLDAGPTPAGATYQSGKMTNGNCIAYRYFNTPPGKWEMWVTSKAEDTKFTLQPIVER
jgi:hypothetical protein